MNTHELPAGDPESPALSFQEIEERVQMQLLQVDIAAAAGARTDQVIDMVHTIILGAFAELLKTLKECKIEPKKVLVANATGRLS